MTKLCAPRLGGSSRTKASKWDTGAKNVVILPLLARIV